MTYWNDLIKKGYVPAIPGFTAEYYTALGNGEIASSVEAVWLNIAKKPVVANWVQFAIFPASTSGLASQDLNTPDKNPSKFFGGQSIAKLYSDASKAVSVDFQWAPWFAFANDNFNKQIDGMITGKLTPKQALDAWQDECLKEAKADG